MNNPFFAMKEGEGILAVIANLSSIDTYPIILCPNSQKFQKTFFPLILQSFEWTASEVTDIIHLPPPLSFPFLSSQNSIADQAISCPGRQRQKIQGRKKQSIIYIQHFQTLPTKSANF